MNDWWNDPPEEPEGQVCEKCDGFGEVAKETEEEVLFRCSECAHEWRVKQAAEPDPPEDTLEALDELVQEGLVEQKCPHGNEWHSCNHCDHLSDLAFDAARETRMRR